MFSGNSRYGVKQTRLAVVSVGGAGAAPAAVIGTHLNVDSWIIPPSGTHQIDCFAVRFHGAILAQTAGLNHRFLLFVPSALVPVRLSL